MPRLMNFDSAPWLLSSSSPFSRAHPISSLSTPCRGLLPVALSNPAADTAADAAAHAPMETAGPATNATFFNANANANANAATTATTATDADANAATHHRAA
eukprot:1331699-Pleurochrysis_carterae.AAC.1